jgi:hypothetical protein
MYNGQVRKKAKFTHEDVNWVDYKSDDFVEKNVGSIKRVSGFHDLTKLVDSTLMSITIAGEVNFVEEK